MQDGKPCEAHAITFPRTKLRQSIRRQVQRQRKQTRLCMGKLVGRHVDRGVGNGSQRRWWPLFFTQNSSLAGRYRSLSLKRRWAVGVITEVAGKIVQELKTSGISVKYDKSDNVKAGMEVCRIWKAGSSRAYCNPGKRHQQQCCGKWPGDTKGKMTVDINGLSFTSKHCSMKFNCTCTIVQKNTIDDHITRSIAGMSLSMYWMKKSRF